MKVFARNMAIAAAFALTAQTAGAEPSAIPRDEMESIPAYAMCEALVIARAVTETERRRVNLRSQPEGNDGTRSYLFYAGAGFDDWMSITLEWSEAASGRSYGWLLTYEQRFENDGDNPSFVGERLSLSKDSVQPPVERSVVYSLHDSNEGTRTTIPVHARRILEQMRGCAMMV